MVQPYPKLYHPFWVCNANDKIMESNPVRVHFSSFLVQSMCTRCPVVVHSRLDNDWTNTGQVLYK